MSGRLITEMAQIVEQERMRKALEPRPDRRPGPGRVRLAARRVVAAVSRRPFRKPAPDGGGCLPPPVILSHAIRREAR